MTVTRSSHSFSLILLLPFYFFPLNASAIITVTVIRNLDFGVVAPNDVAYVLPAAQGAVISFTGGTPGQTVRVTSPTAATAVNMVNGASTIVANTFTGSPVALGTCFNLDGAGNGTYDIGATRAATGGVVTAGPYSGNLNVKVRPQTVACANSGAGVTAVPTATVNGVVSISLVENIQLNFGTVAPGDVSRIVPATAAPTCTGCKRGQFVISGQLNQAYIVRTIPTAALISGGNSMTANTWTALCNGASGSLSADLAGCSLSASGTDTLYIGGTLNVGAAQASGSYSGSYTVTVAYQ